MVSGFALACYEGEINCSRTLNDALTLNALFGWAVPRISTSLWRLSSGLRIGMPVHDPPSVSFPPKHHRRSKFQGGQRALPG